MPRRTIDSCLDIMEFVKARGFQSEIPIKDLRLAIEMTAGALPSSVARYLQMLKHFNFVEVVGEGIFKLNYDEAEKLMI